MDRGKPSVLLISAGGTEGLLALLPEGELELTVTGDFHYVSTLLETRSFDAVLLELAEPGELAFPQPTAVAEWATDTPVVAYGPALSEVERELIAAGVSEYLPRPASAELVKLALEAAFARAASGAPDAVQVRSSFGLLGDSTHMNTVRAMVKRVASGTATVLVRGETGTGKELVARAVHEGSARRAGPFIKVHVSALPDALLESELFGYEKGAFTGANARKAGRVEIAEGGTLFFDEIGEVSLVMQTKLLRLIQDREYERLGGTRTLHADIRFIAATHRDLRHMVEAGAFREDLYYRLNVVTVWVPPLRARRSDVAAIARHYFRLFRERNGKPELQLSDAALAVLQSQRWPGNVRELVNFVERAVVLAEGDTVTAEAVHQGLQDQEAFLTQAPSRDGALTAALGAAGPGQAPPNLEPPVPAATATFLSEVRPLHEEVRRTELRALTKALLSAKGNKALAARLLGVSRRTLYTKLQEHGLS
jgi:two-component system response regulator AtoC